MLLALIPNILKKGGIVEDETIYNKKAKRTCKNQGKATNVGFRVFR